MSGQLSRPASLLLLVVLVWALPAHGSRLLRGEQQLPAEEGPTELVSTQAVFASWPETLLSGYLSNEQLAAWSLDFTTRCSKIARRFSIGKSIKGADLWVIEIAAAPGQVEAKPNFKYVSAAAGWTVVQLAALTGTVRQVKVVHSLYQCGLQQTMPLKQGRAQTARAA